VVGVVTAVSSLAASVGILRWFYWMAFAPFLSPTIVVMLFLVLYAGARHRGEER
jgi:hypothetical protein